MALRNKVYALIILQLLGICPIGCGLDVVKITLTEKGSAGLAGFVLPGIANFGTSLEKALSSKDVNPDDVDSMKLLSCSIAMISQGGITQDLSFLKKLDFYVEATGMDRQLLAIKSSFVEKPREADLEVTPDLELKPYLSAGAMKVVTGNDILNYPPPDLVLLEITFKIRVDVNVI